MSGTAQKFVNALAEVAQEERNTFNACWGQMMNADGAVRRFIGYMVETYHYISFTCPLMSQAAERVRPHNAALAEYLEHHCEEEREHDLWMLQDLERLGLDAEKVRRSRPRRETVALVGSRLYELGYAHQLFGHLGYIFALESSPVDPDVIDRLADRLGLPRATLATFRAHGELDPDHEADLKEVIARHVTTPEEQEAVRDSMVMSYRFLSELVLGLAMDPLEEIEADLARLSATGAVPGPAAQPSA